ncbi:MAG TPA: HD domain-containing protein [Burkholderiaceae bacterium]|nr:HD domain-containing protein [Burkholderiaceae bacterium]
MNLEKTKGRLAFLREAERLKSVLRSAHTSSGRTESTAEHSWRLCLMVLAFEDELAGLDILRLLKLCVVHDLGEAISGDIPAVDQASHPGKREQEKRDLQQLTEALDEAQRDSILALWEEYDEARTPEARAVKALDKLETILQHNQGLNPPDFDYAFNLQYGKRYTDAHPFFALVRAVIDEETRQRMG